jgi:hypothetical protein
MSKLENFLYPHNDYHGQMNPNGLIFNANLQEFSQRVSYISSLETGGKISPEEAFQRLSLHWKQLECSSKQLLEFDLRP